VSDTDESGLAAKLLAQLRGADLDREALVRFTKVNGATARRWLNRGQPPTADRLIRIWHLLELVNGGPLADVPELSDFARYLGQLLAFGIIDVEAAQAICGVKNPQTALANLRGEHTTHAPKMTLAELQAGYDGVLVAAQARVRAMFNVGVAPAAAHVAPSPRLTPPPARTPHAADRQESLRNAAKEMSGLLPTLRWLMSDECSEADRATVRALLGTTIFEFWLLVDQLNSERLRTGHVR